jgi:ATP-binding cassette, subfamily A (ABC1), member 3
LNPFIDMFDENSWDLSYYSSSSVNDWDENNFLQRSLDRKGSFYIEELDGSPNYQFIVYNFINTLWRDALPNFINQLNQQFIRFAKSE